MIHLALWLWAAMFLGSLGLVAIIGIGALVVNVLGRPWCKYLPGHGLTALGWVAVFGGFGGDSAVGALMCWAMAAAAYMYAANALVRK